MTPLYKLEVDVTPGIYTGTFIANIYKDKIIVTKPTVRWVGNTGNYHEERHAIRDQAFVTRMINAMDDDCYDSDDSVYQAISDRLY